MKGNVLPYRERSILKLFPPLFCTEKFCLYKSVHRHLFYPMGWDLFDWFVLIIFQKVYNDNYFVLFILLLLLFLILLLSPIFITTSGKSISRRPLLLLVGGWENLGEAWGKLSLSYLTHACSSLGDFWLVFVNKSSQMEVSYWPKHNGFKDVN